MDIKTVVLALALGNLSLFAALFFSDYENRKSSIWSIWAIAKQCQAAAWFLLYLRGIVPDLLSIVLANALLFAGVAAEAGALWEAAHRPGWRRILVPILALAAGGAVAAYVFEVDPAIRIAASSLTVGGFYLAGVAALALEWRAGTMLRRFLVLTMAALALLIGVRGVLAFGVPDGTLWASTGAVQMLSYGALYLMMLLNGFGCLLLAREKLQLALARQSMVDGVTGVPNRRGFFNALAPWMALARRPGLTSALLLLELDNFKRILDDYGHPVGDVVVRAIVDLCRQQLRDSDQMGRLGGVEFAVLLPRTALADAAAVAERICRAIAQSQVKTGRAMIGASASIGVTVIRADDSTVSLFKRADQARQAARLAGGNRVMEADAAAATEA
jgi:diguanylate cyclase (GGDEF)-like protein